MLKKSGTNGYKAMVIGFVTISTISHTHVSAKKNGEKNWLYF